MKTNSDICFCLKVSLFIYICCKQHESDTIDITQCDCLSICVDCSLLSPDTKYDHMIAVRRIPIMIHLQTHDFKLNLLHK